MKKVLFLSAALVAAVAFAVCTPAGASEQDGVTAPACVSVDQGASAYTEFARIDATPVYAQTSRANVPATAMIDAAMQQALIDHFAAVRAYETTLSGSSSSAPAATAEGVPKLGGT